jgi:hypothetical protein
MTPHSRIHLKLSHRRNFPKLALLIGVVADYPFNLSSQGTIMKIRVSQPPTRHENNRQNESQERRTEHVRVERLRQILTVKITRKPSSPQAA